MITATTAERGSSARQIARGFDDETHERGRLPMGGGSSPVPALALEFVATRAPAPVGHSR
jgi:hypothetical protein